MTDNLENHFTQKDRELISHQGYQLETLIGRFDRFEKKADNSDHERRLRELEKQADGMLLVKKIVYSFLGMVGVAFAGALIALIIK
jgi:hypothetical protein